MWWLIVFLGGGFVSVLSKDLLKFEHPIENAGYAPGILLAHKGIFKQNMLS